MANEAVETLKAAEAEAERNEKNARAEAQRIMDKAEADGNAFVQSETEKAKEAAGLKTAAAEKAAAEKKSLSAAQTDDELRKIEAAADKKKTEALEIIRKEIFG